ncbi:flagellar basal-body rod protein FlgF [Buchnera aphidicola]|jgi:flagellar basal-body rod protein FlgF|uniref:Flagellar basal-body rod protein FlgF n=1 Tax=Buchnera aphidicola subsp. Schizaphis graminum (strain Sg) TaxID=198804 RepID=FLGF_BUCAP|nr:flagellar basal-body rod protein FlgF [Buchnera aphidicola]Q8K9K5.1 RecName: Full=Flagellar basal-body rod protein FlgF [Buchnera aphidicola str. Sg (Schizaphis graminum)]AAM67883.1 flagellar basal-body rod protein FlgF [Buchnera aphidicola str. Sg (Schizaphis graminum)]AWI49622.1 flagellar basal body rod protein FlgF [Buchnera aphidicola (Schizaphis graminum)]
MNKAIYESMNAAIKLLDKQAVIANNLANISTVGFKESFNLFIKDRNLQNLKKTYNQNVKEYYNFYPGTLIHTQRNLDLVIKNNGWLAIKDINGQEAYTKNGHIKINKEGKMTVQNYELIGNNGNIKIPNNVNLKISSNGIIKEIKKNKDSIIESTIGSLKLVRLQNDNLIQKENGLFYLKKDNLNKYKNILHDSSVRIQSEMLEASNVNPTKNMIDMISNARQFEMNMKIISMCDQNTEYANQLFNVNN